MDAFLNKKYKLSTSEKFDEYMKALGKISYIPTPLLSIVIFYLGAIDFIRYTTQLSHTSYWCFNRVLINHNLNIAYCIGIITGTLCVRVEIVWLPVKILWRHDRCVRIILYSIGKSSKFTRATRLRDLTVFNCIIFKPYDGNTPITAASKKHYII